MLTIILPTNYGTDHDYDFLDKFWNLSVANGLTEQQIIGLFLTYLKGTVADWYQTEVGASPPPAGDKWLESSVLNL